MDMIKIKKRLRITLILGITLTLGNTSLTAQTNPSEIHIPVLSNPEMADQTITLNFNDVDIRSVLKAIGEITGINFVPDPKVRGNVTIMSPSEVRLGDLFPILQSILEVHGFTAIAAGGDLVKVVPKADAASHHLPVRFGADPNLIPINDTMVTQILPLAVVQAASVQDLIQPHVSKDAIKIFPNTNTLVITDTSANIHHVACLVHMVDRQLARQEPKVFMIKHVSVDTLSEQIQTILSQTPQTATIKGRTTQSNTESYNIIADSSNNSLIVTANTPILNMIRKLIEQLDVPRSEAQQDIHVMYLNNAEPNDVSESLSNILSNFGRLSSDQTTSQSIKISADAGTNALIIQAPAHEFPTIQRIVEKLDVVREQIIVEMHIVEVSEDDLIEMGVDWATMDEAVSDGVRVFAGSNYGLLSDASSGDLEGLGVGMWRSISGETTVGAILNVLEQQSKVNILSRPYMMASNHRKATIVVGENTPFYNSETTTDGDTTTVKSYDYKDVGITLELTPHVSKSGTVRLELESEFSKLISDVENLSVDSPTTTAKREVKTMIVMQSGETTVIGGLIRDDTEVVEQKIPLLGDIPLLGALFKNQSTQVTKTNLLIFITPHILKTPEERLQMTQEKQKHFERVSDINLSQQEERHDK